LEFLETIKALIAKRPLSTELVEDMLDVALRGDPDNTNPYYSVHRSFRAPAHIQRVEVRVPESGATRKDALVIIELFPEELTASPDDVRKSFGSTPSFEAPSPSMPAESPVYLAYRESWGVVRFGFDRPAKSMLSTVVVDPA
jgi:hypothetical protein